MNNVPRVLACSALFVAFAVSACGDDPKATSASASASAKRPICKDGPASDYEPRCKEGERDCCALLVDGKFPTDPASVELFGIACAGGHVPACSVAREADKPPKWKLDVFSKACAAPFPSQGSCRTAVALGFVLEPDRMADHFANWCSHTSNAELALGGDPLKCPGTPEKLAPLKPDAVACADGAFERCQLLAGQDGNTAQLLRQIAVVAWKARGYEGDAANEILDNRAPAPVIDGATPKGSVGITVSKSAKGSAKQSDAKALTAAIRSRDEILKKCIDANTKDKDDKAGKVSFDVIVDTRGVIAATTDMSQDLKGSRGLPFCVRGAVQDAQLEGAKGSSRARVELTLGK